LQAAATAGAAADSSLLLLLQKTCNKVLQKSLSLADCLKEEFCKKNHAILEES
jgi:hypothetical protein